MIIIIELAMTITQLSRCSDHVICCVRVALWSQTRSAMASFPGYRRSGLGTSNCIQTVMSWQLQYVIQTVNTGLVHVIPMIFPAVRTWLSWSWKQLFAAGSTIEVKQKSFKQKSLSTLSWSNCTWQQRFNAKMWLVLPTFWQQK